MSIRTGFCAAIMLILTGCVTSVDLTQEPPRFERALFDDMPGWHADDLVGARDAARKSCDRIMAMPGDRTLRRAGIVDDWRAYCDAVARDDVEMRVAIQTFLVPWRVTVRGSDDGLFTGYYEASLRGSRTRHDAYQTPIRARPLDHVVVNLGDFKPELSGQRVTGQLTGEAGAYTLKPYPDRAGIASGRVPEAADRVIAWVDDPVDAFYLEIQGSGRIDMDDGTVVHVGYDERNGQAYTAIGRVLVDRGVMTKDQASMQTIRAWLSANPDQATRVMNENRSYIFFRELNGDGPIGGEGVALTPLRSVAVDHKIWPYGLPFFIDAVAANGDPNQPRIQRLMMGQDTGGAIKGAVRGDLFWGYGDEAAYNAGLMKSRGNMWVLLPRGVHP